MKQLRKQMFYHKVITVLAIVICLLTGYIAFKYFNQSQNIQVKFDAKQKQDEKVHAMVQQEAKIIARNVDKDGIEHVISDVTDKIFPKSILKNPDILKDTFVDSIAKKLDIKSKQITDLTVIVSTLKAEKLKLSKAVDSLKKEYYVYNDQYLKLKFTPEDTVTKTPAFADVSYNAKLTSTQYTKQRIPLIGKKRTYLDIFPVDPRMTIDGLQKFSVEQKQSNFGLKLQIRSLYGFDSQKFYFGPCLSFDVGRFNILAYMYYDVKSGTWLKSGGLAYNFLEL